VFLHFAKKLLVGHNFLNTPLDGHAMALKIRILA